MLGSRSLDSNSFFFKASTSFQEHTKLSKALKDTYKLQEWRKRVLEGLLSEKGGQEWGHLILYIGSLKILGFSFTA